MPERCPHCQQTIKRPKPRLVVSTNTAELSDAELFKHYRKIAPIEDVKFWLQNAVMSDGLRGAFQALKDAAELTSIPRADFYRQLTALQALWRKESNIRERENYIREQRAKLDRLELSQSA